MLANVDVEGRPTACARFMGGREFSVLVGEPPAPVGPAGHRRRGRRRALAAARLLRPGRPLHRLRRRRSKVRRRSHPAGRAALATLYVALMSELMLEKLEAPGD